MATKSAIIIGGGIGGFSVAIALEQIGLHVDIYERAPQLKPIGAGISLWANAIKALDQLGVGIKLRELGIFAGNAGFHIPSGRTLSKTDMQAIIDRFGAPPLVIHRADLINILREGNTSPIHLNQVFTHYELDGDTIIAHFSDGTTAQADMLICADGIRSAVRQMWHPTSKPVYSGYTAWRGVTEFDHARIGRYWGETIGRGVRIGITPLPNNRIYWYATQNVLADALKSEHNHQAYLQNLFGAWYDPIPSIIQATPNEAILNNDIYDIDPITEWVRGNVALLGDSAHAMTPNMGQGGCMAIEDAVVLGKCLRDNTNIAQGLLAYQALRVPRANYVQKMSRQLGKVMTSESVVLSTVRNILLRITPSAVQMRTLSKIVGYEV